VEALGLRDRQVDRLRDLEFTTNSNLEGNWIGKSHCGG